MHLLILEGISGSGKTTLLRRLTDRVAAEHRGPCLILTEHHTERALEPLRTATVERAVQHLQTILAPVARWAASLPTDLPPSRRPAVLIERCCWSCAVDLAAGDGAAFAPVDATLTQLGVRPALLTVPPEQIRDRVIDRPRRHRDGRWSAYQRSLAADDDGLVAHYAEQQARFVSLAERCPLPVRTLDTAAEHWDELAADLLAFWMG